jgi:hypothetical protein
MPNLLNATQNNYKNKSMISKTAQPAKTTPNLRFCLIKKSPSQDFIIRILDRKEKENKS